MNWLAGGSLIAFAVAVAVVLSGQLGKVERLIGITPAGARSDAGGGALTAGPLGKARASGGDQRLGQLIRVLAAESAAAPGMTAEQLTEALRRSEPAARVGVPLRRGGIRVFVAGSTVGVCAQEDRHRFRCAASDTRVRLTRFGEGRTLRGAQQESALRARTAAGRAGPDRGGGLSVIDRARSVAGAMAR